MTDKAGQKALLIKGLFNGIDAYGALKTGDLSNHLSLSRASSEGHLKGKTDFDMNTLFYRGLNKGERHRFQIGLGYTDKDLDAYGFYSYVYPNEREQTDTLLTYFCNINHPNLIINTNIFFIRQIAPYLFRYGAIYPFRPRANK